MSTIIRMIENGEISWTADWDRFEHHIYDKIIQTPINKSDKSKKVSGGGSDGTWFCKYYQRPEGCTREPPHPGKVGNALKQVQHICATCLSKERVKRSHPECSTECPYKEM